MIHRSLEGQIFLSTKDQCYLSAKLILWIPVVCLLCNIGILRGAWEHRFPVEKRVTEYLKEMLKYILVLLNKVFLTLTLHILWYEDTKSVTLHMCSGLTVMAKFLDLSLISSHGPPPYTSLELPLL